jgi:hypothetical protein
MSMEVFLKLWSVSASEEKALQKLCQTWKKEIYPPHMYVLKLPF